MVLSYLEADMEKQTISDYTETEFLEFVRLFFKGTTTEAEDTELRAEFDRLSEHPERYDVIYQLAPGRDGSPEGVVREVKQWRDANGKPGFKAE